LICIEDVMELQAKILEMKDPSINPLELSNMQASIESRLAFEEGNCNELGPIAECCRIALLFICFLSFTETWTNSLVPCRLSDILRLCLSKSIEDPIWSKRRNIQTWFLFIGSCVTVLNVGYVENLSQKWTGLLNVFRTCYSELIQDELNAIFQSAKQDFIYYNHLLPQRFSVTVWNLKFLLMKTEYILKECVHLKFTPHWRTLRL
jgi:hypothetical protein